MNKGELVNAISEKIGTSKRATENTLNAILEIIAEELKNGEKVNLIGFGSFETRKKAARKGRNPQTNEEIRIPASTAPAFKASTTLKDKINK